MNAVEYSQRLGLLADAQLQAALDRFDLGTFISAEPAQGGLFGQNVMVTSTKGEFVLRGSAGFDQQLRPEQFFTNLLHERTEVPVPWPYLVERKKDIFGWSYAIMPRMPGAPPNEREPAERIAVARVMGETLARTQRLTWPHCGEYDSDAGTIMPIAASYGDWTVARIRERLGRCLGTSEEDIAWVESVIAKARGALGVPFEPVFTEYDFKENNTVAQRTVDGWRVSGVFDYGSAFIADGEVVSPLDRDVRATGHGPGLRVPRWLPRRASAALRLRRAIPALHARGATDHLGLRPPPQPLVHRRRDAA